MAMSFKERLAAMKAEEKKNGPAESSSVSIDSSSISSSNNSNPTQGEGDKGTGTEAPKRRFGLSASNPPKEIPKDNDLVQQKPSRRFGAEATRAPISGQTEPDKITEKLVEEAPLGKVIQSFNSVITKDKDKEVEGVDDLSGKEAPAIVALMQQKIHNMQLLEDGTELKFEMAELSKMITANGDACRYLLDEDLGLVVRALRRMTDNKVARDMATTKKVGAGSSTPKLSQAEINAALDLL